MYPASGLSGRIGPPEAKSVAGGRCDGCREAQPILRLRQEFVGWVERKAKPIACIGIDGFRDAQPILRLRRAGRSRAMKGPDMMMRLARTIPGIVILLIAAAYTTVGRGEMFRVMSIQEATIADIRAALIRKELTC